MSVAINFLEKREFTAYNPRTERQELITVKLLKKLRNKNKRNNINKNYTWIRL